MILPRIIGHRGAAGRAPENTLAGFRKAKALGAEWVEFDVRITRDSRLAVIHDADVGRTTNGEGLVVETDMAALAALDAGFWFAGDGQYAGERVPSLEQALALLGALGLGANVEVKASAGLEAESGRRAASVAARLWRGSESKPLMSSFSAKVLAAVRDTRPDLPRGLLVSRLGPEWQAQARDLGCFSLHCRHTALGRRSVARIRDAGFVLLAYTVNGPARAAKLFSWGVNGVITDVPDKLLAGL